METIIHCENITHYYGKKLIYENLNFEVKQGKILGLLGKNGTGKTTIINILNGYLKPRSGVCRIFGETMEKLSPSTKARIGLLLEGHIQHTYFNVEQIERFYSRFFPNWKRDAYYELLRKLQVTPTQKISTMSCGQRSQVALGLLFAQDPDLLILDDFSMGLDPGYRRLFVEYLKEYATAGNKTIFLTSHIIQDMEMLIDDCMIMDYGRILLHEPTRYIMERFRRFRFVCDGAEIPADERLWHTERTGNRWETYSFASTEEVEQMLSPCGVSEVKEEKLSLEDAFIGLTGKYSSIMFSAIFYKEWIKTRRTVGLMLLLLVTLLVYAFVQMGQTLRLSGAVQAWSAVLLKDMSLVPAVTKWFPLLAGVLLGVAQFIPEMTDKRLKLTLHLPLRESKIVFVTLLYGIAVLSAAFLLMYVALYAELSRYYAAEMLHAMTWQLLPYFEGGLACYLFTAWVCMEPVWRRRVANALVAAAGLYLFFMDAPSGAYVTFLPCLTLILVAGLSFPFYSAARFKDGSPG